MNEAAVLENVYCQWCTLNVNKIDVVVRAGFSLSMHFSSMEKVDLFSFYSRRYI